MCFFGIILMTVTVEITQAFQARPMPPSRESRSFHHPAYTMLSMYPGIRMGMGSSYSSTECIREDIVCPDFCLMEDEWGCKSCPCGPASGMSPAIIETRRPTDPPKEEHECLGTILCMLTCKDGYKLGPRGHNGCQSCECSKKNDTDSEHHKQHECNGPTCDEKNDTSKNATDGKSEGCKWPLCMGGQSPNSGPGEGSGLTSLPKGGSNAGEGGSVPGIDCIGPACSAKNGMHTMAEHSPARTPTTHAPTHKPRTCPSKESCAKGCDGVPVLGEMGHDGCPVCKCIPIKIPTTPPRHVHVILPEPTEIVCPEVNQCMQTCQYGFKLDQPINTQTCPSCVCVLPLTPPPPKTTRKPSIVNLLRVCQDVVRCMQECTSGYTLMSLPHEDCPVCVCNKEPEVVLVCEESLSCPRGCTVGYRCDINGCPTCNCIRPTESALNCGSRFSCVERCRFGYETGDNGCPTCVCLQPVTVKTDTVQLIPTPDSVHHSAMVVPSNQVQEPISRPHVTECFGPSCSAIQTVGGRHPLETHNTIPFIPPVSNNLHHVVPVEVHSIVPVLHPATTNTHQVQPVEVHKNVPVVPATTNTHQGVPVEVHEHIPVVAHPSIDTHEKVLLKLHTLGPLVRPLSAEHISASGYATDTDHVTESGVTPRPLTAMEACPETVWCISKCNGNYDLLPVDGGDTCPGCSCKDTEPPCESCKKEQEGVRSTPSPGQCVAILHCVMTCTEGYDIGEYGSDGCPTCTCLDP